MVIILLDTVVCDHLYVYYEIPTRLLWYTVDNVSKVNGTGPDPIIENRISI